MDTYIYTRKRVEREYTFVEIHKGDSREGGLEREREGEWMIH